jgi:hypothetical protein
MRSSFARFCGILTLTVSLTLGAVTTPEHVAAQTAADSAAVLTEAARSFEAQGRREVADALWTFIAERYGSTPAGAAALERLADGRGPVPDRSGRVELQVWGTLYGLWLGIAVPGAFGADGSEAYGAGILLGAPAGLLTARLATRSRAFSEGQTRAITWGGTWGTWQGLGWAEVLDLGTESDCLPDYCYDTGDATEERFTAMIVGGLAGIAAGGLLSRRPIDAGVAAGAHYGSLWGSWLGLAGAWVADVEDDDNLWASSLVAGNLGLVAGGWLAARHDLSRNRVRLISLAGLLGGLAGAGVDMLVQPDDDQVIFGIPLALSVAGLGVGTYVTRDHDGRPGRAAGQQALLNFGEGGWSFDVPVPSPTLVWAPDPNGRDAWRRAFRIDLLRGAF